MSNTLSDEEQKKLWNMLPLKPIQFQELLSILRAEKANVQQSENMGAIPHLQIENDLEDKKAD